ncbi:MAG: 1-phosphofructokinase [Ruminococcaceae bacterium]|nr:1-phosphofructokinase [Oscillospiraceae bacterium]
MIYTVTLNPSLDYVVGVKNFREGTVNRTEKEAVTVGGKGINVSLMLHNLGSGSTALGFLAGFTGEEIRRSLQEQGITEAFLFTKNGLSRINVKLKSEKETEINGKGPVIEKEDTERFLDRLEKLIGRDDVIVLSGSLPRGLSASVYLDIMQLAKRKNAKILADVSGETLEAVLPYHPFLVKPNHHELGALFGCEIHSKEEAVFYGKRLREKGAVNVMVSLAAKGAVLLTEDGVYFAEAPKGEVMNSVGAGDSSVAGFLYGFTKYRDFEKALAFAVACGSATAFSEGIGTSEKVYAFLPHICVSKK